MKRFLLAMLLLALAMPVLAADSTYAPGTCYFVQGNTGATTHAVTGTLTVTYVKIGDY